MQTTTKDRKGAKQRTAADIKGPQRTAKDFKLGCLFGKRYTDLSPGCHTKEIIIVIIIMIRMNDTWISICRPTVDCTTLHATYVPSSGNA